MTVEILSDPECFSQLRPEWLELLDRSDSSFFQTPDLLQAWWDSHRSGSLQIIVVRDDQDQLVGLAPLYVSKEDAHKKIQFLGNHELSDYCDFIIDREHLAEVLPLIWESISQLDWQTALFISLPEKSSVREFLIAQISAKQTQQEVCPVITLPSTWEEYLEMIGRKQRHELKRKWKNLESNRQLEFQTITHDISEKDIQDFIRLHQLSSAEKKSFWTKQNLAFFSQLLPAASRNKTLQLSFLMIDGLRVSATLAFTHADTYYLYNSGIDPEYFELSVGNVLTAYTIQSAINLGLSRYDFLRGDEAYKFRFGAVSEPIYDLQIAR